MNEKNIAGYRTVRSLRDNPRSQTILVRAATYSMDDNANDLRVIKRFGSETPVAQILTEIECGSRAQGAHVSEIDDIAAAPDGTPALVLAWQSAGTLRRLLRERQSLRAGEAITILAPLSGALNRIHRAGVALGSINVDAVHFDTAGRPFFVDWQDAQERDAPPTPLQLQADPHFRSDRAQFALLATGVLSAVRVDRESERSVAKLVEWLSDSDRFNAPDWELHCERALFALGPPEPVRLSAEQNASASQPAAAVLERSTEATTANEGAAAGWGALIAVPPPIQARIVEIARWGRRSMLGTVAAAKAWCSPVRKRTWLLAAAGAACVGLATAVLLIDGTGAGSEVPVAASNGDLTHTGTVESGVASGAKPDAGQGAGNSPDDRDSAVTSEQRGESERAGDGLPNSPQDALPILLSTREGCLRDLSVVCLEAVSQRDSPAFAADSALIAHILGGGELSAGAGFDMTVAREIQRLGDSILFEFGPVEDKSEPASLLLVKGEAGWRIRSYTLPE